jgi:hypothetical protein
VIYAVCTRCAFLRAFSEAASDVHRVEDCPACGGELIVRDSAGRFPPAYVSRISFELLAEPAIEQPSPPE